MTYDNRLGVLLLARNKAIFDADILIHFVKTDAINLVIELFGAIYVSDYVFNVEIKKDTMEYRRLSKLSNTGKLVTLGFHKLTEQQKKIYRETVIVLEANTKKDSVNEGEKVTASFAKACNIYYYMSDDNKAAPYIVSLTGIDVVNYCDLLYLYIVVKGKEHADRLRKIYSDFIALFDHGKEPNIIKKDGQVIEFKDAIGRCFDRFKRSKNLTDFLELLKRIHSRQ